METDGNTLPCRDCGVMIERVSFLGSTIIRYCSECQVKRLAAYETEAQMKRRAAVLEQRRKWLIYSRRGIPPRYRSYGWEDVRYDHGGEGNRKRVAWLREWAEGFPVDTPPTGYPSVLLASEANGVGKTLLSCLILRTIVQRCEILGREQSPYQLWTSGAIRLRLRAAERYGSAETPEDVYRELASLWLLIIDDVGKESPYGAEISWLQTMYHELIDRRYGEQLPTIYSSNLTTAPWVAGGSSLVDLMGRAPVSRLVEMTMGLVYIIEGEDRR